jgi:predicted O-methyltransferase YrrM
MLMPRFTSGLIGIDLGVQIPLHSTVIIPQLAQMQQGQSYRRRGEGVTSSAEVATQRINVITEIRRLAPNIDKNIEEVLADMYSAEKLDGTASDQPIKLDGITRLSIAQGAQINQIIRNSETTKSLEIGFAYGFSTVWILDGLRSRRNSRHVAIDPFEITAWCGVGLQQVKRLSVAPNFEWINEYSILALSRLIKSGEKFDFVFIDGNHRFDDVLVDFYLSDQLVSPGGLMAFDDLFMPSVRTVISFVLTNRQYKILPQPARNMMVLKKLADDDRDWRHFESFKVANPKRERMVLALRQRAYELARITGMAEILSRINSRFRSTSRF